MKRRSFLRAILATLAIIAMIIGLNSCTPPPYCEKHNTGDVTIYNDCSYTITVDVNSPDLFGDGFAGERVIYPGNSVTYNNIPAGYIDIWEADAYSDWGYWSEYLNQCEDFEFSIYQGKGVSTVRFTPLDIDKKTRGDKK